MNTMERLLTPRQLADGGWTSKIGEQTDVEHSDLKAGDGVVSANLPRSYSQKCFFALNSTQDSAERLRY